MAFNQQNQFNDQRINFQYTYEISPIVLRGGIAAGLVDSMMSILQLTEGNSAVVYPNVDDYFANFKVISGGTLQDWTTAEYPFASMVMAANAVIQNPLKVSMLMICPVRAREDYKNSFTDKEGKMRALKASLNDHISSGGTFDVYTPSFVYGDCLLTSLRDVSVTSDKQVQYMWQWDFVQPLITQSQATQVYNNLYAKLAAGTPVKDPVENSGVNNVTDVPPVEDSWSDGQTG